MSPAIPRRFPVPERPLTLLGLADGAFAIMRAQPRTVAGLVACFVIPTNLLTSWLQRDVLDGLSFDNFDSSTGTFQSPDGTPELGLLAGGPIAVVMPYVVLPFLGVALTHLVLGWRDGINRSAGQCLRFTLARTHIILAAWLLSKIVQLFTLFIATPVTMLVAPVLAAEECGPIAALRRARRLARPRFGHLIALLFLLMLLNLLLSSALTTLPLLGAFLLDDWGWVAFFGLSLVSTSVLNVLGVGVSVLAYLDLCNRVEGRDLQRRIVVLQSSDGHGR